MEISPLHRNATLVFSGCMLRKHDASVTMRAFRRADRRLRLVRKVSNQVVERGVAADLVALDHKVNA
jgi:hypothetical protein